MSAEYNQNKNNLKRRKFEDAQQNSSSLLMYKSHAISKFCMENSINYFECDKLYNSNYSGEIGFFIYFDCFIVL